ncbi:MAG: alpha/beta fold hydrolase [Micromonosporaceae bacterium]
MAALPPDVVAWRDTGRHLDIDGRRIFAVDTAPGEPGDTHTGDPPIVIVHGFPGSSYDWAQVVPRLAPYRRVVVFDQLGYGLSDKPADSLYSLFEYADLTESLLTALGIQRCVLVGHDMGDTVAAELLHQQGAGDLSIGIDQVFLTNGSIFSDLVQLTRGQRLALALPGRSALPVPGWLIRHSLRESFARAAPPPAGAVDAMTALVQYGGGAKLLTSQIRYVVERRINQDRWTAALVDFDGPMTALWGMLDPIAVPSMAERLASLRPHTEIVTWPDLGHWPPLEAPERLAAAIIDRL